jgi:hypothetical protein
MKIYNLVCWNSDSSLNPYIMAWEMNEHGLQFRRVHLFKDGRIIKCNLEDSEDNPLYMNIRERMTNRGTSLISNVFNINISCAQFESIWELRGSYGSYGDMISIV